MPFRKILFWTHLVVGVTAGLVIFTMAATGTLLAFEHQIVEWAEKKVRLVTPPTSDAQRLTLNDIVAAAQKEKPKSKVASVTLNSDPAASAVVGFGREGSLFVDPYTGIVLGPQSKIHDWLHTVEDIHRYLGKREIGKPITGAAVVLFFGLLVSGLYIWIPSKWTKPQFRRGLVFNSRLTGKARDWNWHNVLGFWFAPLVLITTTTGMIMAHTWATNLLYRATGNTPPPAAQPQQGGAKPTDKVVGLAPLDTFVFNAMAKVPAWETISIRLPNKPEAPVNVNILEKQPTYGIPVRSQLSLDPVTGSEKKWEPFSEANSGRVARVWARYLHTGEVGGIPGRLAAFLSACAILVMVWTGLALSWRRWRAWRNKAQAD